MLEPFTLGKVVTNLCKRMTQCLHRVFFVTMLLKSLSPAELKHFILMV